MKTIYKYPFAIQDFFSLSIPMGAKILKVDLDPGGTPCAWAEVDTDNSQLNYNFAVVGTGHEIPKINSGHVGSFVQGPFVWHIYRLN